MSLSTLKQYAEDLEDQLSSALDTNDYLNEIITEQLSRIEQLESAPRVFDGAVNGAVKMVSLSVTDRWMVVHLGILRLLELMHKSLSSQVNATTQTDMEDGAAVSTISSSSSASVVGYRAGPPEESKIPKVTVQTIMPSRTPRLPLQTSGSSFLAAMGYKDVNTTSSASKEPVTTLPTPSSPAVPPESKPSYVVRFGKPASPSTPTQASSEPAQPIPQPSSSTSPTPIPSTFSSDLLGLHLGAETSATVATAATTTPTEEVTDNRDNDMHDLWERLQTFDKDAHAVAEEMFAAESTWDAIARDIRGG
ncbi:MAG: hypothetical protein Q9222_006502 [Ikaeria aurantiellina]